MKSSFIPLLAMTVIVVASNWLVQFPINDLLTWGAITYPFSFWSGPDDPAPRAGARASRRLGRLRAGRAAVHLARHAAHRAGLGHGLLAGQLLDIQVFQRLRAGSWWRAPLVSSTAGSVVDTALFFSLAFAGSGLPWITLALGDLGVKLILAVLALALFRAVLALALPVGPARL